MAWDRGLPDDSSIIREAPSEIRDNNAAIELADISLKPWALNLIDRTDPSVTGPDNPGDNPSNNTMLLYAKTISGNTELFVKDNQTSQTVIQLTRTDVLNVVANGTTFLPGGVILKWGTTSIPKDAGNTTIAFAPVFPTAVYTVVSEVQRSAGSSAQWGQILATPTTASFVWFNNNNLTAGYTLHWMAIGI